MKKNIGLWIDHRRAVIVTVSNAGEEIQEIQSDAHKHPGHTDEPHSPAPFEAQLVAADDVNERKFTAHLNRYYAEIIACVREAKGLLIFGPGEAKGQLHKQLEDAMPKDCVVAVETTDKMTSRQIAAKVRDHFKQENQVIVLR